MYKGIFAVRVVNEGWYCVTVLTVHGDRGAAQSRAARIAYRILSPLPGESVERMGDTLCVSFGKTEETLAQEEADRKIMARTKPGFRNGEIYI